MTELKVKKDFRQLSRDEIVNLFESLGEKKFRANQVYEWLWQKGVKSFDEMTNLSKTLRELLSSDYVINSLVIDTIQKSDDGTVKVRFKTFDNYFIEGVLIPADDRFTACVSSQVGCSLTCAFCATGKMKRERNLNFDEIFDQVVSIHQLCAKHYNSPLTNIVFMGMGEPLLNYSQVNKAIEKITGPDGFGIGSRRITVSTAGIAKMIRKLGDDKVKYNLAVSLHAATDLKRSEIMPINDDNNLEVLIDALDYYYSQTKNRISYEYILFDGFNDTIEDAKNLLKICKRVPSKVNIIEYNQVADVPYTKATDSNLHEFIEYLASYGVTATVRRSRGKDIDAACGQLANKG